tara:strand:+ start:511 stop:837 length:327 start_codon:yes stop_codon:yes gene_type:complete
MNDFPIDFRDKIKDGKTAEPIKASDLMQDFVWAKLQTDPTLVDQVSSMGFTAFKLKIPAVPSGGNRVLASTGGALSWKEDIPEAPASGTYVLGAVDGALQWIATEECP